VTFGSRARRIGKSPDHQIARSPDPPAAYPLALRFLARRELTTHELRERLAARDVPDQEIDAVIARLTEDGTLNDRRAAAAIARTQAAVKGRGRLRVERELDARGVGRDIARAALDEVFADLPESDLLEKALRRRLRAGSPITDQAHFRRLHQYLLRLGFPSGAAIAALKKHTQGGA
jgi:regulatory protein